MIWIVHVPIYRTTVLMCPETTGEEWMGFYKRHQKQLSKDDCDAFMQMLEESQQHLTSGCAIRTDFGDYIMYVRDKNCVDDVAHEIFHVANKMLVSRGVTHDADAEAWAYLIGWLTKEYYKLINNS